MDKSRSYNNAMCENEKFLYLNFDDFFLYNFPFIAILKKIILSKKPVEGLWKR